MTLKEDASQIRQPDVKARVILQEKGLYRIAAGGCEYSAVVSGKYRYETKSLSDYPCVGDYVMVSLPEDKSSAVINSLCPRHTVFIRKSAGRTSREQVVAANVDTVFICMSLNNDFNIRRLERFLFVTRSSGSQAVVVLTKADLCQDVKGKIEEAKTVAKDTDIICVSSKTGDIEQCRKYLAPGATVAFIGASGVGKSTLINTITGKELLKTSEIGIDDRGRHTTTHRELITLSSGAFVIDTPGMRELGVWDVSENSEEVFDDIETLALKCKFNDCSHKSEPGCAIHAAIESGVLPLGRWNSYVKLKEEKALIENEKKAQEEKRQRFKRFSKFSKSSKKGR